MSLARAWGPAFVASPCTGHKPLQLVAPRIELPGSKRPEQDGRRASSPRWAVAFLGITALSVSKRSRIRRERRALVCRRAADAPAYPGKVASPDFPVALGEFMRTGARWDWKEAQALVKDATEILAKEETLSRIDLPEGGHINVIGDVHGQYFDVLGIFKSFGVPSASNPYLFNGDFVDRGSYSVETLMLLLAWKVAYPEYVRLGRGNHEAHDMNVPYGFTGEVLTKYGEEAYAAFQKVFDNLPLAHLVEKSVLVVHGGLPRRPGASTEDISQLKRAELSREQTGDGDLFTDLMWADPRERNGHNRSERGGNVMTFGPDVTKEFLDRNKLSLLIRSHEVKDEGFEYQHSGKCLTVFSAPNYCDSCGNLGAVVRLSAQKDGPPKVDITQFKEEPKPAHYVPAMVYSPQSQACQAFLSPSAKQSLIKLLYG